jgi:hypothetical protein
MDKSSYALVGESLRIGLQDLLEYSLRSEE